MAKILINYADSKYKPAQRFNTLSGKIIGGFDKVFHCGPEDIDNDFLNKNKEIFSYKRGNGLWLWKPYFIKKIIGQCNIGDIIFYCDSGSIFLRPISVLESFLSDDCPIFVTDIPLIESNWTKPICFDLMNCNQPDILWTNQIQATFLLIKVNKKSISFINEWLELCCNLDLISPAGLNKNEKPVYNLNYSFVSHREDQSILSLLCKKHKIAPHRDISQRGFNPKWYYNPNYAYNVAVHVNDNYPSIVFLHKDPNPVLFLIKLLIKKLFNR